MSSSTSAPPKKPGFFARLFRKKQDKPKRKKSGRVQTWPVPYLSRLEGNQIQPGQSIVIRGFVTGSNRFDINLSTGSRVDGSDLDDIALHVSCRLDEKKIVLNTLQKGTWGKEQRFKSPFKEGDEFDIRIRAHDDKYEVYANHKELGAYEHLLPLNIVSHIFVNGDVELFTVSWEGKYYSVPYEAAIPGYFNPGRKLYVSGEPNGNAKRFGINLHAGGDTAFHFNPRFSEKAIVRNSCLGGSWGTEERDGDFPLNKKRSFDIIIACENDAFRCYIDGDLNCTFLHRLPPNRIEKLSIEGDVELQGVHFK